MLDKIQSPLIDTSLAPVKGAISNSDYVFVRGADESIEKVLVSDLLAGTAGAIRIRGEADMDNASTTSTSVAIIGDPNNATMEQGVTPVDTSPNGVSYVVKTSQSGVQTQISGTVQTVFDGDQIIWSGSKWSILALGNAVTSVDNQTGAVNLEDKYYWTGNKPNIEDIPDLQGTLDSKYSPANKPTPSEIGAKANSYIPDWEEITNKPDTSTRWPSFAEVTSKPTTATRWPTFSEVTGKPATATRWPAFSEVTGKPSTYPPSAHTHTAAQVTGLGTAATATLTTSNTDGTAGRVLKVGDFGLGGNSISRIGLDVDTINNNGFYYVASGINTPAPNGHLLHIQISSSYGYQEFVGSSEGTGFRKYYRTNSIGVWQPWREILQSTNLLQATGTSTAFPMSQKAVTDQLATKAASSHTHTWSQVTGQPTTATRWPTFAEVTNKPTNYATTWNSVAAKPATATRWPTWSEVTGKPTTFVADWGNITSIPVYATRWPTKAEVGLSNVPNYKISNATNDPSTNKFASTAAVYSVSQRVTALEGAGGAGGAALMIGSMIDFPPLPVGKVPHAGYIPMDGSLISRTDYQDLWLWANDMGIIVSEADWQSIKASSHGGAVSVYSVGTGGDTFRVPDVGTFGMVQRPIGSTRPSETDRVKGFADQLKSHSHTVTVNEGGSHRHSLYVIYRNPGVNQTQDFFNTAKFSSEGSAFCTQGTGSVFHAKQAVDAVGNHTHTASANASGGSETTMKYMWCTKWIYSGKK